MPWAQRHRLWRLPVIRGVVALGESMKIGFKALAISANAQLEEDEEGEQEEIGGWVWGLTIAFSLLLAVGLFFVVPVGLTSLIKDQLGSPFLFWLVEGILRTAIFIGYIVAISKMPGPAARLRVPRRRAQDDLLLRGRRRADPRAGQALLAPAPALRHQLPADRDGAGDLRLRPDRAARLVLAAASRILGIPLIAGLSYEVIKWAGKNRRKRWVRAVMWPGLMLQNLTTREPDEEQLAVAIASLNAVLARENPEEAAKQQHIEIVA